MLYTHQVWYFVNRKKSLWQTWCVWLWAFAITASHGWLGPSLTFEAALPTMLPEGRAEWVGEEGWCKEEMVVVVRAERCEDNSPIGEICKVGVLLWGLVSVVWRSCALHTETESVIFNLFSFSSLGFGSNSYSSLFSLTHSLCFFCLPFSNSDLLYWRDHTVIKYSIVVQGLQFRY